MRKLALLCTLTLVFACSKNDQVDQHESPLSLNEQVSAISGAKLFGDAMAQADLDLSGQSLTILAPTDASLQDFLADWEVEDFSALKSLIGNSYYNAWIGSHIIPEAAKLENLHSAFVPTLAQNSSNRSVNMHFWRSKSVVRINGHWLNIPGKDRVLSQGYLHQIDEVLRPATLNALVSAHSSEFSILNRALQVCNMAPLLNNDQNQYTLLAPNDAAFDRYFQSMGCGDLDGYLADHGVAALTDLIKAHLINGAHSLSNLSGRNLSSQLASANLSVELIGGNLIISRNANAYASQAQVLVTDITAFNGSLNIINEVLKLP